MHLKKANIAPHTHTYTNKKRKQPHHLFYVSLLSSPSYSICAHFFFPLYMHAALSAPYEQFYSLFLFFFFMFVHLITS